MSAELPTSTQEVGGFRIGDSLAEYTSHRSAVKALKRLDHRFGGDGPGRWTFDGMRLRDGLVADALLSLRDALNDIDRESGGR